MQVQPRELCLPDNLKLVSPKDPSDLKSKCLLRANVNKLMAKFYKNIPSNEIHQFFVSKYCSTRVIPREGRIANIWKLTAKGFPWRTRFFSFGSVLSTLMVLYKSARLLKLKSRDKSCGLNRKSRKKSFNYLLKAVCL